MNNFTLYLGKNRKVKITEQGVFILRCHRPFGPLPFVRWDCVLRFDPFYLLVLLGILGFVAIAY